MAFEPRSVYIAFEAFPRPKGASAHIASMIEALSVDCSPVLLLCLGYGDMPAFQNVGSIQIQRFKAYHPNMLRRAFAFGDFVQEAIERYQSSLKLALFRDPWGGRPLIEMPHQLSTIFEVNALPSWELSYTYPAFLEQITLRAKIQDLERACLRSVDRIITVSALTGVALQKIEPRCAAIEVIRNSAHPAFEQRMLEVREAVVERCDEDDSALVCGYVGSLHPWQGVDVAIDAFALIAEEVPLARMKIITAGRKETRKQLRKQIRKRGLADCIDLLPGMPPEQLADEMQSFAFTVAPLLETPRNVVQGCCPVKIIESMAAGVPVIASNLTVTVELIDDGKDGILVRPGCPRALAHAMLKLFSSKPRRDQLSKHAMNKAQINFSRKTVHASLHALFNQCADLRLEEVS